ncbi:unnamed protein product [Rotaria sp. Silwood1]|nr:unnamed protein product [Rotaria sp. Silwood1]CAF4999140.1 unnamed protein product [Rotaria sp. Silwood1]
MKMYAKYGILDLTYADFSYQSSFMLSKIKILLIDPLSSPSRSKSLVIEPRKPSNARQKVDREERTPRSNFLSNSINFETSHQRLEATHSRSTTHTRRACARTHRSGNMEVDHSNIDKSTDAT